MDAEFKVPMVTRRTPALARSKTPTMLASTPSKPRQSSARGEALSAITNMPELQVGDQVTALQYSGILRFLGTIGDKPGVFGGIELTGEHRGSGKNDGSVNGTQYFDCDINCGIFVPANRIQPSFAQPNLNASTSTTLSSSVSGPAGNGSFLPRPPSTTPRKPPASKTSAEAARAAEARIQPGSRASKYLNMTASQLHSRPVPNTPSRNRDLASSTTTIKAVSPSKTPTPRPKSRQSFGVPSTAVSQTGMQATPSTGVKKSLAASVGPPPTPRSIRRPASRNASAAGSAMFGTSLNAERVPEVPPLPTTFSAPQAANGRRTPSVSGRITPASGLPTPGSRRYSQLESRPNTPARSATPARSVSRQSNASDINYHNDVPRSLRRQSNIGRPSSRASLLESASVFDSHEMEILQAEKLAAQRSADEARLAQHESERALRSANAKFEELRLRLETTEQQLKTANSSVSKGIRDGDEAARQGDLSSRRIQELESRLIDSEAEYHQRLEQAEVALRDERQSKQAALKKAQMDLDQAAAMVTQETADLHKQVAQLKAGGAELCRVYDEELDKAAQERLRLQATLEAAEAELVALKEVDRASERDSAEAAPTTPSALSIDNETLRAETEHLRNRLHQMEDQLEESRSLLEQESAKVSQKRLDVAEAESVLRKEIKSLKDALSSAAKNDNQLNTRITDLEKALSESKSTLEKERAELETLRADQPAASSQAEDVRRMQTQVESMDSIVQDLRGQNACLSEEVKLLEELRADLEQEIEHLKSQLSMAKQQVTTLTKASDSVSTPNGRPDIGHVRDENTGLKHIINQLNTEVDEYRAANKQLLKEAEALREAQATLEQTVTTLMEESEDRDENPSPTLRRSKNSLGLPLASDAELQTLRTKISEVEKRKNKEIGALQQEIAELETLIEVKIFKEDALDSQLSLYRDLLKQAQAEGFKCADIPSSATATPEKSVDVQSKSKLGENEECEMCGQTTHTISDCPIMNGSLDSPPRTRSSSSNSQQEFCEICENHGHDATACPSANDVF